MPGACRTYRVVAIRIPHNNRYNPCQALLWDLRDAVTTTMSECDLANQASKASSMLQCEHTTVPARDASYERSIIFSSLSNI